MHVVNESHGHADCFRPFWELRTVAQLSWNVILLHRLPSASSSSNEMPADIQPHKESWPTLCSFFACLFSILCMCLMCGLTSVILSFQFPYRCLLCWFRNRQICLYNTAKMTYQLIKIWSKSQYGLLQFLNRRGRNFCSRQNVCVKIQSYSNFVVLRSCPDHHVIFYWLKKIYICLVQILAKITP